MIQIMENEDNYTLLKVKNKKDEVTYILKNIKFHMLDKNKKKKIINETKILASLKHPNIIEFKEAFYDKPSNTLNIIMEFISNGNLSNIINCAIRKRKYIEESLIWKILTQILIGLNYLHNKGIIHRDLRSSNIFLSNLGIFKIAGFNGFCLLEKNKMIREQIGTPLYSAPEIWKDEPYNYKCDIWSVGCIIYELATLTSPFTGDNLDLLYNNIMSRKMKSIPEFYSKNLKDIINSMLIFDPLKRPSTDILLNNLNIKQAKNELNYIYMNFKMKIINLKEIKNKYNMKEINLRKNKIKINSKSTANINSTYNCRLNKEINMNKNRNKIVLPSYNGKGINNATYRTLKERKNNYSNSDKKKIYNYEKIELKNNNRNINNILNEDNNHSQIVGKSKKLIINDESLNTTPTSSIFNYNTQNPYSKLCYDIQIPNIQNYSFKNVKLYEQLDKLYNESKSIKNKFKQKNLNYDFYESKIIKVEKNENSHKINLNNKNKDEIREKILKKQKKFIKERIITPNNNKINNKIDLLNNENSENKDKENIILRNYKFYHDTSINNSNKKNTMLYSNYSHKTKPKFSQDNMRIINNLNEKAIKTGRNKYNNLYNNTQVGDYNYIVKSNENLLDNKYNLGKICYFDNCNSNLLNFNNFNKYYKSSLPNKKKPINFNCNNIIIRSKASSSHKHNYLKNQPSPLTDKANSFINVKLK